MSSFLVAGSAVGVAVISLVFIVGGYLLIGALWYLMVYRPSRQERARAQRSAPASPDADEPGGARDADATTPPQGYVDDS